MTKSTRTPQVCALDECTSPSEARGYCNKHYLRYRKYGDPNYSTKAPAVPAVVLDDGSIVCKACGEAKPPTEYHRDSKAKSGYRATCKPCRSAYMAKQYETHRDRIVEYARERRASETEHMRALEAARYQRHREQRIALATTHAHTRRARLKQLPNEPGITTTALRAIHGDSCYYCHIPMSFTPTPRGQGINPSRATIEHLIPISKGGGHTMDNTVLACHACNVSKNAKTVAEYKAWQAQRAKA